MSQSPDRAGQLETLDEYLTSFDALGVMIAQGKSFSGRERNCLFLNLGNDDFGDVSSATGFDLIDDGRGIAVTDWDGDGDLDLWLNNRTGPRIRLLKNTIANANRFLSVKLQGSKCNRDAIGARVELHLSGAKPRILIKSVRAGDGFLSQSSKTLHFGFRPDERITQLSVWWPGSSRPEVMTDLLPNRRYEIVQNQALDLLASDFPRGAVKEIAIRKVRIQTQSEDVKANGTSRLFLTQRPSLPHLEFTDFNGQRRGVSSASANAQLITLWASWCAPCLAELSDLSQQADLLALPDFEILALSVDGLDQNDETVARANAFLQQIDWPYRGGLASKDGVRALTRLRHQAVYHERPLPLPSSFLVDRLGNVAVIYQGPLSVEQVLQDVRSLELTGEQLAAAAFPFPGRTATRLFVNQKQLEIQSLVEAAYVDEARTELMDLIRTAVSMSGESDHTGETQRSRVLTLLYLQLGRLEQEAGKFQAADRAFHQGMQASPRHPLPRLALASLAWRQNDSRQAERWVREVLDMWPDSPQVLSLVGSTHQNMDDPAQAIKLYRRALVHDPSDTTIRTKLAVALQFTGATKEAMNIYRDLLRENPQLIDTANNLAWILATHPDPELRDAEEALELATEVARATLAREPSALDTLAAALAASGDFAMAQRVVDRAMELAQRQGRDDLAAKISARKSLYRALRPFRGE